MNNQDRIKVVEAMNKTGMKIILEKGESYADGERDTLSNFKAVAERGGTTVIQAWLNYFLKHEIAIELAIKKNPETPIEGTEGILSRLLDAKNYLDLLACILVEKGMLAINEDGTIQDKPILVPNGHITSFGYIDNRGEFGHSFDAVPVERTITISAPVLEKRLKSVRSLTETDIEAILENLFCIGK